MKITIENNTKTRIAKNEIERLLKSLCLKFRTHRRLKRHSRMTLSVAFVSAKKAAVLNKKFRGKSYVPDVLSFETPIHVNHLGDIVMCPERIGKEALENQTSVRQMTLWLLIHGFLHLLGFDHEKSAADEKKMMAIQDKLFENFLRTR